MSKIISFLAVACFAFFFLSCKRCDVCIVKDSSGNTYYEYPQQCGTKKELDNYEQGCKQAYETGGLYTCECS